jgi:predicted RNase H-like HicB family nuclease
MPVLTYPALLEPTPEGGFGVTFPDLPGCVTVGDSYEDAIAQAIEALSLHLEGMAEDGDAYPTASRVGAVSPAYLAATPGGHVALIAAMAPGRPERVNISMNRSLLDRIDRFATDAGLNRSAFLALAAKRYLNSERV